MAFNKIWVTDLLSKTYADNSIKVPITSRFKPFKPH